MRTVMPLAKPWPVHATHRSLKCAVLRYKMDRLKRRKLCRRSRSVTKKMTRSRNLLTAPPKKKALRRSRSVKARASGVDDAVVEEGDAIVLLIAARKIRQQPIVASRRNPLKPRQRSKASRDRRAMQNQGMKAAWNRGLRDATKVARTIAAKIGVTVTKAGRS